MRILKYKIYDLKNKRWVYPRAEDIEPPNYDENTLTDLKVECLFYQFTGLIDVNNKEIYENDRVIVYPKNFVIEKLIDNGDNFNPPIYEADLAKELPFADIPIGEGIVTYNQDFCAFEVRFEKPTAEGVATAKLSRMEYNFELI